MRQIESVKKKDENFFDILLYIRWKWDNVIFGCNYIFEIERRRYHSFMRARGDDNYLLQIAIVFLGNFIMIELFYLMIS